MVADFQSSVPLDRWNRRHLLGLQPLEPWELEAGFVLACQSRPHSEKIILDFDAV